MSVIPRRRRRLKHLSPCLAVMAGLLAVACRTARQPGASAKTGVGDTTGLPGASAKTGAGDTTGLPQLREVIVQQVGEPRCSEPSECRTIPLGSKPCGGPWSYLIYSAATTDSAALEHAVRAYNAREAEQNRKSGRVSDCSFIAPPKLTCDRRLCITYRAPPRAP